jgi:hypothetical protein
MPRKQGMNKAKAIAMNALLALGCGAAEDGYIYQTNENGETTEVSPEVEIGQAAQGITSQMATGSGSRLLWGFHVLDQGSTVFRTDPCRTDQAVGARCIVPQKKVNVSIGTYQGACNSTDLSRLTASVNSVITVLNNALPSSQGWSLIGVGSAPSADLKLTCSTTNDNSSNDVNLYIDNPFFQIAGIQLTESLPGIFNKYQPSAAGIRVAQAYAKGTSASQDIHIIDHLVGNMIVAVYGVGFTIGTGFYSSLTLTPSIVSAAFTPGQYCRARFSGLNDLTIYNTTSSGGCDNS